MERNDLVVASWSEQYGPAVAERKLEEYPHAGFSRPRNQVAGGGSIRARREVRFDSLPRGNDSLSAKQVPCSRQ
jgi:hypothetical protein